MPNHDNLREIKTFPSLVKYLRDELDWPIEADDFEDLTFDYEPEELGIDAKTAAKIEQIKQLRPLVTDQPWGIFFVKFEPKRLPVMVLRRILSRLVIKKRTSAKKSNQPSWLLNDLLFISNYGEGEQRQITFAHFSHDEEMGDLPTLKVLGWDDADTALHIDHAHQELKEKLHWQEDDEKISDWRSRWSSLFTLRHKEVITTSKALSERLAKLAADIRKRVNTILRLETDKGPIRKLQTDFKTALIHDLSDDDFADMYAQTITYGLLTARVSRPAGLVAENVTDMVPVTNPFLRDLMSTFLTIGGRKGKVDFDEVGINDVVQTLREANMEAVLRDFGDRKPEEDPVIFFYEDFLKAYDKKKKVQRGVFYTPKPVVSFIVRSIHEILQKEFGLEDGLADTTTWGEIAKKFLPQKAEKGQREGIPGLKIPAGTSPDTPFVQILDPATGTGTFLVEVIEVIFRTLTAKWIQQGLTKEQQHVSWNDYVPKHLLPRVHGYELMMAPYAIAHMKIGLKLNETGYRFGSDERARIYLTNSLEPPTDMGQLAVFSEALAHEAQAVNTIKSLKRFTVIIGNPPYSVSSQNDGEWILNLCKDFKKGLDQERNIQPLSDDYIKFLRLALFHINQSQLGLLGMITNREYIQGVIYRAIRKIFFEAKGHITICDLHGQRGELVVSSNADENIFEIEKGVAISIIRFPPRGQGYIEYGEVVGKASKKADILSKTTSSILCNLRLQPIPQFYFFKPWKTEFKEEYFAMPSLVEFFAKRPVTGFATHRDHFAISFSKEELIQRVKQFLEESTPDRVISSEFGLNDTRDWQLHQARISARRDSLIFERIRRCAYRPFDYRWVIYSDDILEYSRHDAMQHVSRKAPALICSRIVKDEVFAHVFLSEYPVEKIFLSPKSSNNAQVCLSGMNAGKQTSLLNEKNHLLNPLSARLVDQPKHEDLFRYIYAVLNSPSYRSRYAEFLKIDFPHLPLTGNLELFRSLSLLGNELVALHLMESPKLNNHITKWQGKTPSGEIEKVSYSNKTVWIDKAILEGFHGISENVWNFHIGGYQVCHKWLKDRKGRRLSKDDIEHYQKIVVTLNETIRLMTEIDEVINAHGGWPDAFQTSSGAESTGYESEPFEYLKAAEGRPEYGQRDKDKSK